MGDDADITDNADAGDETSYFTAHIPTGSYLTSSSVPTTPGILADSRNVSYTNLAKRKKLSTDGRVPLSDTHLEGLQVSGPLHHHHHGGQEHSQQRPRHHQRSHSSRSKSSSRRDSEWLLRAGLAMSSSAREEKGQSWLVKRESSTSLVSDAHQGDDPMKYSVARKQRSGASTRAPPSRRASGSHPGSRRASRPDLGMTPRRSASQDESAISLDHREVYPDFVDEAVRQRAAASVDADDFISTIASESEFSDSDSADFDELEMQRLTRQRGFGLGSWIDRLVEWTLFSVEEEYPASSIGTGAPSRQSAAGSLADENEYDSTDQETVESDPETHVSEALVQVGRPADQEGAWADARWFLGLARRVIL